MLHKVLLVDDEVYARKGLCNIIDWEACGFLVPDEADNGEDALALIKEQRYDLVITDIRMPVLDGLELIRLARESKTDSPAFIIISGFDDFKYAQQAVRFGVIDFILKPIDEHALEATLIKLSSKLNQDKLVQHERNYLLNSSIMTSLIKGEVSPQSVATFAERLGVEENESVYYIFVEVNDIHPWRHEKEIPTQKQQLDHIQAAIRDYMKVDKETYLHVHRNRYGFVVSESQLIPFSGRIDPFAKGLQQLLSNRMGELIYIYVGAAVSGLIQLGDSYKTAKDALLYKYAEDESKTVVYEQVNKDSLNHVDLNGPLFKQLEEDFEEHNESAMKEDIKALFEDFQTKRYVPETVKLAIHHCVSGVMKAMRNVQIADNEFTTLEPIIGWQDLNVSLGELKRLFIAFIFEASQVLAAQRRDTLKGGIQKIKSYIEANFHENISLKSISGQFYMNPVYLGQLFRKSYGIYFNDFLLHIRVNEAKKLLRQTDKRIYEIAEEVGFSNADYFVTQFEKIEQMTPTEYRNSLM